jgi:hypothetical protein
VRILLIGVGVLAALGTRSLAQEESCVSALESRIKAGDAVLNAMPHLEADCRELREKLDAFVTAESTLRKSDKAVRRACPAGEFVRGDSNGSVRAQFVLEAVKRKLANCQEATKQ